MPDPGSQGRFEIHRQRFARLVLRVLQMLWDTLFFFFCVAFIALVLAVGLIFLTIVPVIIGVLLLARLCYWAITRVPMWFSPNSVGRLHRWPVWLNATVCAVIGFAIASTILVFAPNFAAKYASYIIDLSWPLSGAPATFLAEHWAGANCGDPDTPEACRKYVLNWLSSDTAASWLWGTLALAFVPTMFIFALGILSDAARLCMIERHQPPAGPRI